MVVFGGGRTIFLLQGFASKRESSTYDPVNDLQSKNTTKNTLNIMFFGKGVSVPMYGCIISARKVQHHLYFQINV